MLRQPPRLGEFRRHSCSATVCSVTCSSSPIQGAQHLSLAIVCTPKLKPRSGRGKARLDGVDRSAAALLPTKLFKRLILSYFFLCAAIISRPLQLFNVPAYALRPRNKRPTAPKMIRTAGYGTSTYPPKREHESRPKHTKATLALTPIYEYCLSAYAPPLRRRDGSNA